MDTEVTQRGCDRVLGSATVYGDTFTRSCGSDRLKKLCRANEKGRMLGGEEGHNTQFRMQIFSHFESRESSRSQNLNFT